jgi:membrane protein implicated in regulation of membrane protease activity
MTWSDFYLVCFIVGFVLSVLSFVAGAVHIHLPFRLHMPVHGGHHGGTTGVHGNARGGTHISWFNGSTFMVFLAWFGGIGYLLTRESRLVAAASLILAASGGIIAASVVFKFMAKLTGPDEIFEQGDYRVEGSVGTISVPIRQNGTGEIVFSLGGTRRCSGARRADGAAIEKGAEVVIERYEKGIAYVKRWDEFTN